MIVEVRLRIAVDDANAAFAELAYRQIRAGAAESEQEVRELWSTAQGEIDVPLVVARLVDDESNPPGCQITSSKAVILLENCGDSRWRDDTLGVQWSPADSEQADVEGWDVFDRDGAGVYEIEGVDEKHKWESDDAVLRYIAARAAEGSPLHLKALYLNGKRFTQVFTGEARR